MKTLKNIKTVDIGIVDLQKNIYCGRNEEENVTMIVRQPRRADRRAHKKAWNQLSATTLRLYKRQYGPDKYYDSKWRCSLPYYDGVVPGFLPLIMEIDGKIVGFGDFMFMMGDHYQQHEIPHDEVGASMNLCVVDKYHGLGIGTFYSHISVEIARVLGAHWALGYTKVVDGMHNIRMKQGWETVRTDEKSHYSVIRKRL